MSTPHTRERGFTFVELMFATAIIVVATLVLITHLTTSYSTMRSQRDRVFAFMTAKSILDEVQALAEANLSSGTLDVNTLDDGAFKNPTLSIATEAGVLVPPDHEISGNIQRNGQWLWSRQIAVRSLPGLNNRTLRHVTARVFKRDFGGTDREIVSLSTVVNSAADGNPTTQVFDVYFLAIENIPGWWVHMESIRPFMEAVVTELERNNPGLQIRSHWITKSSYGRNRVYRPYVNVGVDSNQAIPSVYYYPGLMPSGSATVHYYVPNILKGRYDSDLGEFNGYDVDTNPYPYAFADGFNHAMRYPREREFHDQRVAAVKQREADIATAIANGDPVPPEFDDMSVEPTLRLLLEDMSTDPDKHRNALLVNLHGELLPMPPLRNYSDAAKEPAGLPNVRVVTHPEELRTERPPSAGTTDVRLRVYAYTTDPDSYAGPTSMPTTRPIAVQIMDLDLTDGAGGLHPGVILRNLRGGVSVGGTDDYFPFDTAKPAGDPTLVAGEMYYEAQFVDPGPGERKSTIFLLYNTPVVSPPVVDTADPTKTRGLFNTTRGRLYDLEYVPACTEVALDFSRDLYTPGDGPKNTARWVITVPGQVFADAQWVDTASPPTYYDPNATPDPDRVLTVRTRIWDTGLPDPLLTGSWPEGTDNTVLQPENLSETYAWWTDSAEDVPLTERAQFQGDPRHNPYKDLWTGDPDFPDGYNWYFDSLTNNAENSVVDYPGIDPARVANLWNGRLRQDLPRFLRVLRTGLVSSQAVFSTLAGWSFYYVGFGGEVGYDSNNGYPNSIPVDLDPMGVTGDGYMDTIRTAQHYVRQGGAGYWWGMPWLGELFHDATYSSYWLATDVSGKIRGNLPASSAPSSSTYLQDNQRDVYAGSGFPAFGTYMYDAQQQSAQLTCTSFFNIGTDASTYRHQSTTLTGTLVGVGLDIAGKFSFALPTSTTINRPFDVDLSGSVAEEWNNSPYSTERHSGIVMRTYYDTGASNVGSGLVKLVDPSGTLGAYVVPNGMAESATVGTSMLAKFSLLSTLQSFFEAGDTANTHRIEMPPRVLINDPTEISDINDPVTIDLRFDVEWKRWDGQKYSESMLSTFSENEGDLVYVPMYSKDGGATFFYMEDDSPSTPGTKPGVFYQLADGVSGEEVYTWNVPAGSFPAGTYLIRVEAYRNNSNRHYAFDQARIYISR